MDQTEERLKLARANAIAERLDAIHRQIEHEGENQKRGSLPRNLSALEEERRALLMEAKQLENEGIRATYTFRD